MVRTTTGGSNVGSDRNDPPRPDFEADLQLARQAEDNLARAKKERAERQEQLDATLAALGFLSQATMDAHDDLVRLRDLAEPFEAETHAEEIASTVEGVVKVAGDVIRREWAAVDWAAESAAVRRRAEEYAAAVLEDNPAAQPGVAFNTPDYELRIFAAVVDVIREALDGRVDRGQLAQRLPVGFFRDVPQRIGPVMRRLLAPLVPCEDGLLQHAPSAAEGPSQEAAHQTPPSESRKKAKDEPAPVWIKRIQAVIAEANRPLSGDQIKNRLRQRVGRLRHYLSWMAKNGHLSKVDHEGYWLPDLPVPKRV
jgi:hypothetical protein